MSDAAAPLSERFGGSRPPPHNRSAASRPPSPTSSPPISHRSPFHPLSDKTLSWRGEIVSPFSALPMLHKGRQQIHRFRFTAAHRLLTRRARHFLTNYIRTVRSDIPSAPLRAALGYLQWRLLHSYHGEDRISVRTFCFVTGRARGTSRRFTVSRTRVRQFAAEGRLFGLRKSS